MSRYLIVLNIIRINLRAESFELLLEIPYSLKKFGSGWLRLQKPGFVTPLIIIYSISIIIVRHI